MDPTESAVSAVAAGTLVIDASVLIAHLDGRDPHHHRATDMLLTTGAYRLAASTLTLAETLVGPARAGRLEVARSALRRLGVLEVPVPVDSAIRLAGLRAETKLRLPDCAVLLAAGLTTARGILTFDDRLADRAAEFGLSNGPPDTSTFHAAARSDAESRPGSGPVLAGRQVVRR